MLCCTDTGLLKLPTPRPPMIKRVALPKKTEFQLGISKSNATAMGTQGHASAERRGIPYGAASSKLPNATEETHMTSAADGSVEKRQYVTESIAKSYGSS